jgi:MinD-like ATPase involved in chromosome partitioning or flagellar assembly/CheY-like chemotaxis protein
VSGYRILLIDQDSSTTLYLEQEFNKIGVRVIIANTLKEGLISAYQHRPQIIVLDPPINNPNLKEFISKLKNDWRISTSKLIAFSSLTSPDEIQSVLNLGFLDYVSKGRNSVPILIRKVIGAAESSISDTQSLAQKPSLAANQTGSLDSSGKTIVFLSGKGGIGTSSLCVNIAHTLNINKNHKITALDLVLPIGSLSTIVGLQETVDIVQATTYDHSKDIRNFLIENLATPHNWNFRLLAGSDSPAQSGNLDVSRILIVLNALKQISDYVFIDLGKTLSQISLPIIKSADQIVLTLSLDQTTVEHTKTVWKFLQSQGVEKNRVYFLINRAVGLEGLTKSQVEEILGTVIQLAIPYMGGNFTLANNLHQPVVDKFPQDSVSISLRQASDEISRRIQQITSKMEYL